MYVCNQKLCIAINFSPVPSVYTMQLILECKKKVGRSLSPDQAHSLTFTDLGNSALGAVGKWMVNIAVLCCNLGVCAGYMIFISSNLQVKLVTKSIKIICEELN